MGLVGGVGAFQALLTIGGFRVVDRASVKQQQQEIVALRQENDELFDELFSPDSAARYIAIHGELPYEERADAHANVATARALAIEGQKYLMVTFGANWCLDCRTLYGILNSEELTAYTSDRFLFVNVDVGKFNRNTDLAVELGVTLTRGIPVAVFFSPDGQTIGTTNAGQLEPARRYTSKQVLKFVKDIAERSLVNAPDEVH